jgi:transcriptional regulator
MYNPPAHRQEDREALFELMTSVAFATLVTVAANEPYVSHVPMHVVRGDDGARLRGHVARANAHWRLHGDGAAVPALAIFLGGDDYVSPRWYPSKAEHGRVVPTWNYRIVHARGTLRFFHGADALRDLVASLSDAHERAFDRPWSIDDAPADYIDTQLRGIVGFELAIESLEGKWKLSQNRSVADRFGAIEALESRGTSRAIELARAMRESSSARPSGRSIDHEDAARPR